MFTETMVALSAALVFGAATAAVAMINYEANASLAALDARRAAAAVHAQNRAAGCDTGAQAIFGGQLTRICTPMKQYSTC